MKSAPKNEARQAPRTFRDADGRERVVVDHERTNNVERLQLASVMLKGARLAAIADAADALLDQQLAEASAAPAPPPSQTRLRSAR